MGKKSMELFEKAQGHCEIRGMNVEILMVAMKKTRQKAATKTPVRCQSASSCPKSSFCRFVNPLTTRIPVTFAGTNPEEAEAS